MTVPQQVVEELVRSPPYFHQRGRWALPPGSVRWIAAHVRPGWRTIETGCGSSTVLFTALGAHHTAISPNQPEHDAIRAWCRERGIPTEHLTSIAAMSQEALPALRAEPFDLALIDGAHSFPIPIIDWYYLAARLKIGGFLLIDDLHIRAPLLLHDFLQTERDSWRLETTVDGMAVFRRTGPTLVPGNDWVGQPWSRPSLQARIRGRLRIRSRILGLRNRVAGRALRR